MDVRELDDVADLAEASRLLARIWGSEPADVMPVNLLKALAHSANYVAGAWMDGAVVGASVAWVWGPDRPRSLHSHITGVAPHLQGRGVGVALKTHQAAWARARGIWTVTWTFDPLIRRNGRFNLATLGAVGVSYHHDFYGSMPDGINAGELSDRCFVEWDLSRGEGAPPSADGSMGAGRVILDEVQGRPVGREAPEGWDGPLLCRVPVDAVALRREDPATGAEWRMALRQTMGSAMAAGYLATGMTADGFYILERRAA